MANLSYAQLEGIWLQAAAGTKYATQTWAALMAAIAEAESGGNPAATNPTDNGGRQTSWGLWQISLGNHAEPSPNWNNPLINAQLALGKLQGQGLGAWGTYTSGAYKAFLSGSTTPDTSGITDATLLAATSASAAGSASQAADANECAWSIGWGGIPGTSWLTYLNPFSGSGGNIGSGSVCLISKSQVRGITGVGLIVGGVVVMNAGLYLSLVGAGISAVSKIAPSLGPAAVAGRFARGAAASATAESRTRSPKTPAPTTYSGGSPSGSTPPPAGPVTNRPPQRTAGPAAAPRPARTGGRTQQGSQRKKRGP